jgi:hypothetical protein
MFEALESRQLMATLVEVRLDALALDGVTPITQVARGTDFLIRGQASDLSSATPQGALQIYTDIAYNSAEITPVVSEVQRLDFTGLPVSGTFTLTYGDAKTAPINFVGSAQGQTQALAIQSALNSIPELSGNIRVDRDTDSNVFSAANRYYIRFINQLADTDVALITPTDVKMVPDPNIPNSTAGISLIEYAPGLRSNSKAFAQSFAYNSRTTGVNESLDLFPEFRRAVDATNEFQLVGGSANLLDSPGSGFTTFFIARVTATTGGADNAVSFSLSYPVDDKGAPIAGSETFLFPSKRVLPAETKFTYGSDGSQAGKLQLAVVAPVIAVADKYTVSEDSALAKLPTSPLANDLEFPTPTGGSTLTIQSVSAGSKGGTINIINSGKDLNYRPAANFFGTETFTYVAKNQAGLTDVGTVSVVVTAKNDAPSFTKGPDQTIDEDGGLISVPNWATNLSAGPNEASQTLAFSVTNNTNTALFSTQPTIDASGKLSFRSAPNRSGTAAITVQLQDNGGVTNGGVNKSATQTFNITVNPVNDAPIHKLPSGQPSTIESAPLLFTGSNAISISDADAFASSVKTTLNVEHGRLKLGTIPTGLVVTGDNSAAVTMTGKLADINSALAGMRYTATTGYLGADTLVLVTDDQGRSGSGGAKTDTDSLPLLVRSSVLPFASPDTFTFEQDSAGGRLNILANDFAHPGAKVTLVSFDSLSGLVSRFENGTPGDLTDDLLSYSPPFSFVGTQTINYIINDTATGSNDSKGVVTINVVPKTDNPKTKDDAYNSKEDTALTIPAATGVLANDTDPLSGKLTAVIASQPANGGVTLNADGSFTYTPAANFTGQDSFTYNAQSSQGSKLISLNPATVTITVANTNDAPSAAAQKYNAFEDTKLTVNTTNGLLKGAADLDGDALTAVVLTQPTKGTLVAKADGSFEYTPRAGVIGTDSFTYQAKDSSNALSKAATATITIANVNKPPVGVNDAGYVGFKGQSLSINAALGVLKNDSDPDGDSITALIATQPANGTVSLKADGSFLYTPQANFTGTDTFTYRAVDNSGSATNKSTPATVTLNINATNTPPTAVNQRYSATEDTILTVSVANGLTKGGTDPEGAKLSAIIVSQPTKGTLTASADGSFVYNPNNNLNGNDSFTYQLSDGFARSTVRTAKIEIAAVNDTPPVVNDTISAQNDVANQTLPDVIANDRLAKNVDGIETLSLASFDTTTKQGGTLRLGTTGRLIYTPKAGFSGTDAFNYVVRDAGGATNTGSVTLNVRFVPRSELSGFVYRDLQGNGVFDSNEPGLGGVSIQLTGTDLDGNAIQLFTRTNAAGAYAFRSLAPGNYKIREIQPRYIQDGIDRVGSQGGTLSNDLISVTIPNTGIVGGKGTNNNFGEGNLDLFSTGTNPQLKLTTDEILASSARSGMLLGYSAGQQTWFSPVDASWSQVRTMTSSLSADGSSLTVRIVVVNNGVATTYATTLFKTTPGSTGLGFRVMATNDQDFQILRIVGDLDLSQFSQV